MAGVSESHRTKLIANGIPLELIEKAGIFSVSAEDILSLTGVRVESTGIAFPYPGEVDGYVRVRLDQPKGDMKYVAPRGGGCRLYVPPGADLSAPVVVITEGEKKALVTVSRGINCVAVAGIDAWRERGPLGEKQPPDMALIGRLRRDWKGQTVVLVYDSDITQEHPRWDAFPTLAEILYSLGATTVKVLTLPALDFDDKVGLDDYILAYEAAGKNPVDRFWEIVNRTPEWVPISYIPGAEKYAEARLKPDVAPDLQVLGAAAFLAVKSEFELKAFAKEKSIKNYAGLKKAANFKLGEIKKQQECKASRKEKKEAETSPGLGRNMVDSFPQLAVLFSSAVVPYPESPGNSKIWDIRDSKIVLVDFRQVGEKVVEFVTPAVDTVAVLTRRLSPVEAGTDAEKWEVAWWEPQEENWRRSHVPASWLFDAGQKRWLIEEGVPVCSENIDLAVQWFHSFRMAVLRGNIPAPTSKTVNRCGWFGDDGDRFFVFGPAIITNKDAREATAGDYEERDPGGIPAEVDQDVTWARDISANEQQILRSFRLSGNTDAQKDFLLGVVQKYPQAAFGLGCAAGAPLIRFAQAAGLSEVAGFTVLMHGGESGRRGRQGKTTWSQVVASFYGCPEVGERLRYADRTRVQMGVYLSTCSDLTLHLEDLQKIARESKKVMVEEVDYLLHLVAAGMERERGARAGGGRRTKYFKAVVFATAEYDVTASIPAGSGAHDRIMRLPPLLAEDTKENAEEAELLAATASRNYGHAGKEYLAWLVKYVNEKGTEEIVKGIRKAIETLKTRLPTDDRRGSAGRLAKRAGIGLAGLLFWLEQVGADVEVARKAVQSFLAAWDMVCDQIPVENLAERVLQVVQAFVAENQELIAGLRQDVKPPTRWAGAKSNVEGVECIVLFENFLAETLERRGIDLEQAKKALAAAGFLKTRDEGGKTRINVKVTKPKAGISGRGWAFPVSILDLDFEEGSEMGKEEKIF